MSLPPKRDDQDESSLAELVSRWRWRLETPLFWRLAAVLAAVVAVVGWVALRGRAADQPTATQIANAGTVIAGQSAAPVSGAAQGSPGQATSSPPAVGALGAATVVVDVIGPVRRPGVISLPAGSRVGDAISAAGGFRPGKEPAPGRRPNLARILQDGEQVDARPQAGPDDGSTSATGLAGGSAGSAGATGGSGGSTGTAGGPISLNQATLQQLDQLPRVGPVTAQKIIDFRQQHGGFRTVEQLKEVPGIGDRTFEQLAPLVRV